jgi:alkanesulfonate monooxygenase SsuD/methylene tetrahydromethanopterin reductase-like flavin-dependent oxidoreductase (luciferase family)
MQWVLMTEPHVGMSYDTLRRMARFADTAGLDAFARSDHYFTSRIAEPNATDAFATLAGLARETKRVELVVLVSPITFRHPAVIAKTAATIDEMSGGRLALGVGAGWMEAEHQKFGLPFPALGSDSTASRRPSIPHHAFGRSAGGYSGKHYSLENDEVFPRPRSIRLIVGGSGERRTPRLAGTYADEYNGALGAKDDLAARMARVRAAAERPDAIPARSGSA